MVDAACGRSPRICRGFSSSGTVLRLGWRPPRDQCRGRRLGVHCAGWRLTASAAQRPPAMSCSDDGDGRSAQTAQQHRRPALRWRHPVEKNVLLVRAHFQPRRESGRDTCHRSAWRRRPHSHDLHPGRVGSSCQCASGIDLMRGQPVIGAFIGSVPQWWGHLTRGAARGPQRSDPGGRVCR